MGCYRVSFNDIVYTVWVYPEDDDDVDISVVRLKNHIVGKIENVSFSNIRLYFRTEKDIHELSNEEYVDDEDEEDDLYEVVIDNAT